MTVYALSPSLAAGAIEAPDLGAMLERRAGGCCPECGGELNRGGECFDCTYGRDGCARYMLGGGEAQRIADELPASFVLRRECCAFPDVVVWACDEGCEIVYGAPGPGARDLDVPPLRYVAEIWASAAGFHARLDELAPIAA